MWGWFNRDRTRAAGLIQAARGCHKALVVGGRPASASCNALARWLQAFPALGSGKPCHSASSDGSSGVDESVAFAGTRCSSTPVWCQSAPACSKSCACCKVTRRPLRLSWDSTLSSGDTCGTTKPAGKPDAPWAGSGFASSTCTCQPRRARLLATAAPANPPPITTQREASAGRGRGWRVLGFQWGAKLPLCCGLLGGSACSAGEVGEVVSALPGTKPQRVKFACEACHAPSRCKAKRVPCSQQRASAFSR